VSSTASTTVGRFVDRNTFVYERRYAHPIERVWEAVSTAEHLDVWMLPISKVERRLGGAASFTWGSTDESGPADTATVRVWEPPTAVEYAFSDESWMRFDLAGDGDGATVLHFTLHYGTPPDASHPWHQDFLAGFHEFLDDLDGYLDGSFTEADRATHLASAPDFDERHRTLCGYYREQLETALPSA
jgi:uncharacterized protein YndB with AHSA1/START domain